MKPLAIFALVLFGAVLWVIPDPDRYTWIGRIVITLTLVISLWYLRQEKMPANIRGFLKQPKPASEIACAACGGPVVIDEEQRCARCNAECLVVI